MTTIDVPASSEPYLLGRTLWDYLRVPAKETTCLPGSSADTLIMVLGSPDVAVADHAADLLKRGVAERAVVSGGCFVQATSPPLKEADAIAVRMERQGIDPVLLRRELQSSNTSEHFWNTKALLEQCADHIGGHNPPKFVILVPTPIAERRALATGRKRWPESQLWIDGIPEKYDHYMTRMNGAAALGRMVGEIERILTYPIAGYMVEPDEPVTDSVLEAYKQLRRDFNSRPIPAQELIPVSETVAS